jgi:NADH-quinone oxidoreductase subunit A
MSTSVAIVAYLALFAGAGIAFLFVNLLVGYFVRPANPHPEKQEVYECGEPTIGSSYVQFDLRFYVVALLFIIFDVEVAFFFPWAVIFGKSTHLMDKEMVVVTAEADKLALSRHGRFLLQELGVNDPQLPKSATSVAAATKTVRSGAEKLAWLTMADIGVFFAVLMVGFAYVWRRGDLDWVRATASSSERTRPPERAPPRSPTSSQQSVLSA